MSTKATPDSPPSLVEAGPLEHVSYQPAYSASLNIGVGTSLHFDDTPQKIRRSDAHEPYLH